MTRILFICLGNICRSPMAEFVMKDLVEKAGRIMIPMIIWLQWIEATCGIWLVL